MVCSNGNTSSYPYKTKAGLCPVLAKQVKLSTNSAAGKSTSQNPLAELMKQYNTYNVPLWTSKSR